MKKTKGHRKVPLSFTRRMVIASVDSNKKNAIHCLTKIDVSIPRALRQTYYEKTGIKLSFTAYIVRCFAETLREFPEMNSFIRRNSLILLDDVTVSVMVEREIDGVKVPEPLGLQKAQEKTVLRLHEEIREAQENAGNKIGDLTNTAWIKMIPGFLIRTFIKIADGNINMAKRYGKVAVTAVGMYANSSAWFIPHGTATVLLTVGSMSKEAVTDDKGTRVEKKFLHITASFDHEIIDGSPAARFMSRFEEILQSGDLLQSLL